MCTIQRCAEISLTKACMVSFPMWAKYKICKATTAWHGMIVLIDKLVICQTNFIEAYLVKNTWTSRNQNSLKSSCFIRRLTDLPNPDLAYLLVRCWNLFTEVPGCFLFNKVTFHFRMIFPQKPWDWESCREAVRKDKKIVTLTAESWELTTNGIVLRFWG